jgi:phosphohistidine phosphatase
MTLTLILTRHAKSSWEDPALDDFNRPLNDRGRRAAAALGEWLTSRGYLPEAAVLSPARRTVETFDRLGAPFAEVRRSSVPALYEADAGTIMEVLRGQDGAQCLILVGHNPGIGDAAATLAATPPRHAQFSRYPTGATTVLRFPGDDWSALADGAGDAVDFVVPRELGIS